MIRRTLAIAGAAVLAIGVSGLAGPASADPGAGIAQQSQAVVAEVGVDMDTTVGLDEIRGEFIELEETTGIEDFELAGLALIGCNDVRSFSIVEFGLDDKIPAGGHFLVASDAYTGPELRDLGFDPSDSPDLVQSGGGVRLVDATSPEHDLRWGSSVTACSAYNPTGVTPTDAESINWNGTAGDLLSPTPENRTS